MEYCLKTSEKLKIENLKNLITWMYLKQTGNKLHLVIIKSFIAKNSPDYPRINRLRYLAEQKII